MAGPAAALPPILGRRGDLPARLLLWAALCFPNVVVVRPLALADRAWPALPWSAAAACAVAALRWSAFVVARRIAVVALPAPMRRCRCC